MSGSGLSLLEAVFYGLIQGVTEFLPVSSSGHLAMAHLLGLGTLPKDLELPFDVLLHAGTLVAIGVAFAPDIWRALRLGPRVWGILLIAIVPTGIFGLVGKELVEGAGERWWVMGICYLITAGALVYAERRSQARVDHIEDLREVTPGQALVVGLFQVPSLLPGISRSGATIAGGLIAGLGPVLAVSYAFLVGLPLIAAAAAKDAIDGGFTALHQAVGFAPLALAFTVSVLSGLVSIVLLRLVVKSRRLVWFAGYCVLVAIACFALQFGLAPGLGHASVDGPPAASGAAGDDNAAGATP